MKGLGRPLAANHRILPGYRLSLGFTLLYLTVLVAIPLAACLAKVSSLSEDEQPGFATTARDSWRRRRMAAESCRGFSRRRG